MSPIHSDVLFMVLFMVMYKYPVSILCEVETGVAGVYIIVTWPNVKIPIPQRYSMVIESRCIL